MSATLVPVVLWTQKGCGPCITAPAALKRQGIPHVTIDVKHADAARVANWRKEGLSTPIVEASGRSYSAMDMDALAGIAADYA